MGPSQVFGFPQEIWVMGVGLAMLGVSGPIIFIPLLPELITIMNEKNRYLKEDP